MDIITAISKENICVFCKKKFEYTCKKKKKKRKAIKIFPNKNPNAMRALTHTLRRFIENILLLKEAAGAEIAYNNIFLNRGVC